MVGGLLFACVILSTDRFSRLYSMLNPAAVLPRLQYHTAQFVLMQAYPVQTTRDLEVMHALQLEHAHQVCGIVTHNDDCEIALVAIQSLLTATPVLNKKAEQVEVLRLLDSISARSGLRVEAVKQDLKEAWGWETCAEQRADSIMGESLANQRELETGVVLLRRPLKKTPSEAWESDMETFSQAW